MGKQYKYYELIFTDKEDNEVEESMCVLAYRKPTIEEAKEFWEKDIHLYFDGNLTEINEISYEDAQRWYEMSNEEHLPIFGEKEVD